MQYSGDLHILLLSADPSFVSTFSGVSKEFGIEAQPAEDSHQLSEHLNQAKYAGVVVDFDTVSDARPALATVRQSRSNKNAIVFAVATHTKQMENALEDRAHFLLRRPIETDTIKGTLRAAYDLMLRDCRRQFRCTARLPVKLAKMTSGTEYECSTMNVSSNGMAVSTPVPLQPAETLDIALLLPNGFTVRGTAIVVWDDKHGKSGLHFQCNTPEMRTKLDCWLDSQFSRPQA